MKKRDAQLQEEIDLLKKKYDELKAERDVLIRLTEDILTRILGGYIPICAKCKKIRDTEGFWQRVEDYIKERSEANFTHTLCPECKTDIMQKYYENRKIDIDNG